MKIRIAISSLLLILPSIVEGQAVPTAVMPVSSVGGKPHCARFGRGPTLRGKRVGDRAVRLLRLRRYNCVYGDLRRRRLYRKEHDATIQFPLCRWRHFPNQGGQGISTFWNVAANQGFTVRRWIFNSPIHSAICRSRRRPACRAFQESDDLDRFRSRDRSMGRREEF